MSKGFTASLLAGATVAALSLAGRAGAAPTHHLVTGSSPPNPFPQNKQTEPGLAINPLNSSVQVAGSNDEIDVGP
jgi:hypothetical protein